MTPEQQSHYERAEKSGVFGFCLDTVTLDGDFDRDELLAVVAKMDEESLKRKPSQDKLTG